jgi:phospholipid/cholesterol/gamma-HCH transport system substrate-binding protein
MKRELFVGATFAVILSILMGVTLWVEEPGFFRRTGNVPLTARFPDVAGLTPGAEVWIYGTPAGRTVGIRPDGKGDVEVDLLLDYDPGLRSDATVEIRSRSALGGAVVSIHPGRAAEPRAAGPLVGKSAADAFGEIASLVAENRTALRKTIENLEKITGDLSKKSDSIVDNVDVLAKNARAISDDLVAGKGTLGKLLQEDTLHRDLTDAIASIRKLADDANGGKGALAMLLHDEKVAQDLRDAASNVRSVTEKLDRGEGTLAKLLNDGKLHDDLASAVEDLRGITSEARSGKGALAKLLNDEGLAKRLDTITEDVADITGKIRRGEGTLGKLVNDEKLYDDLTATLKSLRVGVDDVRENAPILTFTGLLFSGF